MDRSLGRNWLRVQIEMWDVIAIANVVMPAFCAAACDHFVDKNIKGRRSGDMGKLRRLVPCFKGVDSISHWADFGQSTLFYTFWQQIYHFDLRWNETQLEKKPKRRALNRQ